MDTRHAKEILSTFLTFYAWKYRYVNGSWWSWDPDHEHWDWMGAKGRMGDAFVAIARDAFPTEPKIHTQVGHQYLQDILIRDLRPRLTHAVLPGNPRSE